MCCCEAARQRSVGAVSGSCGAIPAAWLGSARAVRPAATATNGYVLGAGTNGRIACVWAWSRWQAIVNDTDTILPAGPDDPFLLRGLVWCELCQRPMEPATALGSRYYACQNPECPTVMVPAEGLEQLVWRQYVLLYEKTDNIAPTAMRWTALRRRLKRVRVGEDLFELWHEWRD